MASSLRKAFDSPIGGVGGEGGEAGLAGALVVAGLEALARLGEPLARRRRSRGRAPRLSGAPGAVGGWRNRLQPRCHRCGGGCGRDGHGAGFGRRPRARAAMSGICTGGISAWMGATGIRRGRRFPCRGLAGPMHQREERGQREATRVAMSAVMQPARDFSRFIR
jgi:hypothetical protein